VGVDVHPGEDGWTVTHYVHIIPQEHYKDHEPWPGCPCGPAVEEFDHDREDGVTDTSFAVYHHDPRRGLRAVRDTTG
jgi:hypothetical protein